MGLEIEHLSLNYGKNRILKDLSFQVNDGEIVALFGPSGVGKTSLLKIIAGIQTANQGTVTFSGDFSQDKTVIVFQDFWLFPHMTVTENIAFGLKAQKFSRDQIKQRIAEMLTVFDLKGLEKHYPDQLSGGQKQRVALARAIVLEPKLLLLDEPFANLDHHLRQSMRDYLRQLQERYRFSIVLVTHDRDEAFQLADRMILMLDGEIQQIGTPKEIYFYPANKQVAETIGEGNYLPGSILGNSFKFGEVEFSVENPFEVMGAAILFIPYGTEIEVNHSTGVPAIVESSEWSPNGQRTQIKIGEISCTFTNLSQKVRENEPIFLNFKNKLQVMAI